MWTAGKKSSGYGAFYFWGQMQGAHRVSWLIHTGAWPGEMDVLHACDNPPCVNPAHLSLGTAKDNVADMHSKGRGNRGERNGGARLTWVQVRRMRAEYAVDPEMYRTIARRYRCSDRQVADIIKGVAWREVA